MLMMTAEEAIRRIEDHIRVHGIGERPHIRIAEALYMAIDALEEYKGTEKPRPFTQEELREMDGRKVYCVELNANVKISAYRTGFIHVAYKSGSSEMMERAMNLTLYPADSEGRNGS